LGNAEECHYIGKSKEKYGQNFGPSGHEEFGIGTAKTRAEKMGGNDCSENCAKERVLRILGPNF
jgi:hypothetical protein